MDSVYDEEAQPGPSYNEEQLRVSHMPTRKTSIIGGVEFEVGWGPEYLQLRETEPCGEISTILCHQTQTGPTFEYHQTQTGLTKFVAGAAFRHQTDQQMMVSQRHEDLVKIFKLRRHVQTNIHALTHVSN